MTPIFLALSKTLSVCIVRGCENQRNHAWRSGRIVGSAPLPVPPPCARAFLMKTPLVSTMTERDFSLPYLSLSPSPIILNYISTRTNLQDCVNLAPRPLRRPGGGITKPRTSLFFGQLCCLCFLGSGQNVMPSISSFVIFHEIWLRLQLEGKITTEFCGSNNNRVSITFFLPQLIS